MIYLASRPFFSYYMPLFTVIAHHTVIDELNNVKVQVWNCLAHDVVALQKVWLN